MRHKNVEKLRSEHRVGEKKRFGPTAIRFGLSRINSHPNRYLFRPSLEQPGIDIDGCAVADPVRSRLSGSCAESVRKPQRRGFLPGINRAPTEKATAGVESYIFTGDNPTCPPVPVAAATRIALNQC